MKTIISVLPDTVETVNAMPLKDMVDLILTLTRPSETLQFEGDAALRINGFLAHAAVRLARAINTEVPHITVTTIADAIVQARSSNP